ncbi:MAG TPA: alkaline phosphatase family protein [Solirubrobacterales bacterium]|nr:alkaline phosphatase family protein [Solirubrobacterales bacterium]
MSLLSGPLQKAIAAAASLTGKRFSLLVASSLVATTGVVAVGAGGPGGTSPFAAAAVRALIEEEGAVAVAPTPTAPEPTVPSASSPAPAPSAEAASSGPLPAPAPTAEAPAAEPEAPVVPSTEPEAPEPGPVQHVFWISLASPGYEAAFGASPQMPYLASELRPQGLLLTNYSLLDTGALPNGIAAISGQAPTAATKAGCPSYEDCLYEVETLSLADQLVGARLRWHGYFEGMTDVEGKPDNCVHPEPEAGELTTADGYSSRLNPFVFFHSLLDLGDCDENDVPLSELAGDLKKADSTANLSYISPGLCNAGFRGTCPEGTAEGAAAADAFLAKVVPEILASPAYKQDGLLIVSFGAADPAPPADPAAPVADPKKVGALLASPLLAPGATDGAAYNPYSLLRSIEDLFALEPLGAAGGAKVRSFATAFTAGNSGD